MDVSYSINEIWNCWHFLISQHFDFVVHWLTLLFFLSGGIMWFDRFGRTIFSFNVGSNLSWRHLTPTCPKISKTSDSRVRVIKNGWYCSLNQICLLLIGTQFAPLNPDWQQTDNSRNVSHKVSCTDLAEIRLLSNVLSIFFLILHLSETNTCWFHVQT